MSERCAERVWDGWHQHRCTRKGTVQEDGKGWCKQHAPALAKAKREERDRKWQEKWDRQDKERAEAKAADAEVQRRADCYDDLLAALERILGPSREALEVIKALDRGEGVTGYNAKDLANAITDVETAIAKAKERA